MNIKTSLALSLDNSISTEDNIPDFLIGYENYLKTSTAEINFAIISIENSINNIATEGIKETLTKVKYGIIKLLDMIIHAIDRFVAVIKDMFFSAEKQIMFMKKRIKSDTEYSFSIVADKMEKKCKHILLFGSDFIKSTELLISTWPKQLINTITMCCGYLNIIGNGELDFHLGFNYPIEKFLYFEDRNGKCDVMYYDDKSGDITPTFKYDNEKLDTKKKVTGATILGILERLLLFIKISKDVSSKIYETKKLCRNIQKQIELRTDITGKEFHNHAKRIKLAGIIIPQNMLKTHAIIIKEVLTGFQLLSNTLPNSPSKLLQLMLIKTDTPSRGRNRMTITEMLSKTYLTTDKQEIIKYADVLYKEYTNVLNKYGKKITYYDVDCYSIDFKKMQADDEFAKATPFEKYLEANSVLVAGCALSGHIYFNPDLFPIILRNISNVECNENINKFSILHELGHRMDICKGKIATSGKDLLNNIGIDINDSYGEAVADAYAIKQMGLTLEDYSKNYRIIHPRSLGPLYDFADKEAYELSKKI